MQLHKSLGELAEAEVIAGVPPMSVFLTKYDARLGLARDVRDYLKSEDSPATVHEATILVSTRSAERRSRPSRPRLHHLLYRSTITLHASYDGASNTQAPTASDRRASLVPLKLAHARLAMVRMPLSLSLLANSTMRIAFLLAGPTSMTNPTCTKMSFGKPRSRIAISAPKAAIGTASRMMSGPQKFSNYVQVRTNMNSRDVTHHICRHDHAADGQRCVQLVASGVDLVADRRLSVTLGTALVTRGKVRPGAPCWRRLVCNRLCQAIFA
jgi:hypothetical protein